MQFADVIDYRRYIAYSRNCEINNLKICCRNSFKFSPNKY